MTELLDRTGVPLVAVVLVSTLVTACGGSDALHDTGLVMLAPGDEALLGPRFDHSAKLLMFLPLVQYARDGTIEPRLARAWEPAPDYRSWIVHLDTRARWHDGVPVTSADIAFTAGLLSRPEVGYWWFLDATIRVIDDSTFVYRSTRSTPLDTYQAYYPKHVLDTLDPAAFYDWEFWRHPIGNGPYRYLRHVPKTALELEATPDFYLGTPRIERVTFKFGTGGSGIPELLAGNVHVVELDPASRAPIARDPRFTFTWNSEFANDFAKFTIFFNHRHSILKHAQVRRAITHAIDRRELVGLLQLPEALPIADVPYTDRLVPHLPAPLAYDPDRARALLADAGWTDRDRDGVRDDGTTPLAFTLLAPEGEALRIAVLVQERLRQVGIAVEVEPVGGGLGVFWSRQRRGEFDAALGFWSPGHLQTFGAESFLGYRNAAVARLLQAADTVAKPQVIDSLYRLVWREFARDIPVTYLFPLARMWAVDRRLQGLVSPARGDPFASLGDLWWDDGP